MNNKLVMYCGPMFSGKSSRMLLDVEKYRHSGKSVHVFKPSIDGRYDEESVVTHMGWKLPATPVETGQQISAALLENPGDPSNSLVVVDELFMIPGAAEELLWLFKLGLNITVATLDLSSACRPLAEVASLMPFATSIVKCTAACSVCGLDASYTYRKPGADESEVLVGGAEIYEPRCLLHHPVMMEAK